MADRQLPFPPSRGLPVYRPALPPKMRTLLNSHTQKQTHTHTKTHTHTHTPREQGLCLAGPQACQHIDSGIQQPGPHACVTEEESQRKSHRAEQEVGNKGPECRVLSTHCAPLQCRQSALNLTHNSSFSQCQIEHK